MNNNLALAKKSYGSPVKSRTVISTSIKQRSSKGMDDQGPSRRPGSQQKKGGGGQKQQPKPDNNGRRPLPPAKKTNEQYGPTNGSQKPPRSAAMWREGKIIVPPLAEITYVKQDGEWQKLDAMILQVYKANALPEQRQKKIKEFVDTLEAVLRAVMKGVRLDLFGSTVNGCGSTNADLDICFRFKEDAPPKDTNPTQILTEIKNILKKKYKSDWWTVIPARVPIVKFKAFGMDGDISFYNETALKNTAMFKKYCEWEPRRFPQLVLFVKRWAKDCTINCSAAGTLSSYALCLMLIHFLQQCSPPVFPSWNLDQDAVPEDYDFGEMPVITAWSKNTLSVSQLFVGFLDYYSRFDFSKLISILRKDLADKGEKKYMDNLSKTGQAKQFAVAIEDPYLPEFNPGYTVKHKFNKIRAVFRLSREVFMNKCDSNTWDRFLITRCVSFEAEGMDDFEKFQLEGLMENERRLAAGLPMISSASMKAMATRVFKAAVSCGGEGSFDALKRQYKSVNKSDFDRDKKRLYGTYRRSEVFDHPFLKQSVAFERDGSFKLVDGLRDEVADLVEKFQGFGRMDEEDEGIKKIEEGARRFLKVVRQRQTMMNQNIFLSLYLKHHGVAFNTEEREKYFGTSDMDEIVRMVSVYGLKVSPGKDGQYFLDVHPALFSHQAVKEVKRLIRLISTKVEKEEKSQNGDDLEKDEENITPPSEKTPDEMILVGISHLRRVIIKFPENTPIRKFAIRQKYRELHNKAFTEEERQKFFGKVTFHETMLLLKEHGMDIYVESKGMYSYALREERKKKKIPPSGFNHPFLNRGNQPVL